MSEEYVIVNKSTLTSIADEVRNIDGSSNSFVPTQIASTLNNVNSSIGAALLALTGNKTSTLSVNIADGQYYHYRAKMTDVNGRVAYSDAAMLSVTGYIVIIKQPVDVTAAIGDTVAFTVEATGVASYQWEWTTKGTENWKDTTVSGNKTNTLTPEVIAARYNNIYRCKLTDSNGNVCYSDNVRLINPNVLAITKQPVDVTAPIGETVAFRVEAVGDGLSYQWEWRTNEGNKWNNTTVSGNKTNTLTPEVIAARYNNIYRCKITDSNRNVLYTDSVRIIKPSIITITTQPQSVKANVGDTVNFTIRADNVAIYQWQVSTDNEKTWQNVSLADEKYTANSSNTVHDMAGMIEDLTAGSGNSELAKKIIDRTITEIEDSSITRIGSYAFAECYSLTSANFPVCTSIGGDAFRNCSNLTSISFPKCTFIGDYAFYNCSNLTSISFPKCTSIENDAFGNCSNLASISFPKCSYIGDRAFYNCPNLSSIDFPECTSIENNVFGNCTNLTSVNFPTCSSIGIYAFYNCHHLITFILGYSSVVTISASNIFQNTPMSTSSYTGTYGSIYVPASLVSAYQSATNWSYYSSRITSITT